MPAAGLGQPHVGNAELPRKPEHGRRPDTGVKVLAGDFHGLLFAKPKDISQVYEGEFRGMTVAEVPLQELLDARARLMHELPRALNERQREFLMSFVSLQPSWELLQLPHVGDLPGVRWKLENLTKLRKSSPERFEEQAALLARGLAEAPRQAAP